LLRAGVYFVFLELGYPEVESYYFCCGPSTGNFDQVLHKEAGLNSGEAFLGQVKRLLHQLPLLLNTVAPGQRVGV
jgi:hypothetical protein